MGAGPDGLVQSPEWASTRAAACSAYRQAAVLPGREGRGGAESKCQGGTRLGMCLVSVSKDCHTPGGVTLRTSAPTGAS